MPVAVQKAAVPVSYRMDWHRGDIALQVFRASTARRSLPLVLYFHGGVFHSGTPEDAEPLAIALSDAAVIVSVAYPLAPACRFPDTVERGYDALQWVATHARALHADPARLYVAGDQAGGNLAAAIALMARDRHIPGRKMPRLAGQALVTPLLDPTQASPSMQSIADPPCRSGWSAYLPCLSHALHPYAAPLHSRRLCNLPPALIVTAEHDPLRDEAESYAAKLIRAGVPARLQRMDEAHGNLVHPDHPQFNTLVAMVRQFVTEVR